MSYESQFESWDFFGTFFASKDGGPRPTVIFASGSGCGFTRDDLGSGLPIKIELAQSTGVNFRRCVGVDLFQLRSFFMCMRVNHLQDIRKLSNISE